MPLKTRVAGKNKSCTVMFALSPLITPPAFSIAVIEFKGPASVLPIVLLYILIKYSVCAAAGALMVPGVNFTPLEFEVFADTKSVKVKN
jgi:hypothetical protein